MHRLAPLACLAVALSGCVTLVRGPSEPVVVEADRDSAYVFVDGVPVGEAPGRFALRRSQPHTVEVVSEGYQIAASRVERELNPLAAGASFVLGGPGGVAMDAATGALYDLGPNVLRVALTPDSAGADAAFVATRIAAAQTAAAAGYPGADPDRRRDPPWLMVQTSTGVFGATTEFESPDGETTRHGSGGLGLGIAVGQRTPEYAVFGRALIGGGVFLDNSERWEVAVLAGPVTEALDGRIRLAASAGAGLSGGRGNSVCFLCGSPADGRERQGHPTRIGLAGQLDVFVFPVPQVGFGLQLPVDYRVGDTAAGLLFGLRIERM